jgi:hypothetical protein
MMFVQAIRSKSMQRRQSKLDEEDPLANLMSPLPEEKFREIDMVIPRHLLIFF